MNKVILFSVLLFSWIALSGAEPLCNALVNYKSTQILKTARPHYSFNPNTFYGSSNIHLSSLCIAISKAHQIIDKQYINNGEVVTISQEIYYPQLVISSFSDNDSLYKFQIEFELEEEDSIFLKIDSINKYLEEKVMQGETFSNYKCYFITTIYEDIIGFVFQEHYSDSNVNYSGLYALNLSKSKLRIVNYEDVFDQRIIDFLVHKIETSKPNRNFKFLKESLLNNFYFSNGNLNLIITGESVYMGQLEWLIPLEKIEDYIILFKTKKHGR